MELRKGYKQSLLGPIPIDWIEGTFEDFMTGFSSGQTPYRAIAEYYKGDIPWITSGELNYNIVTETIERISNEGVKAANLKLLPKGTFLFAITGLEAAGTRGSCAITGIEATTNQSCMALYPKQNFTITPYIFQFYVKYGNWLALNFCQGTKQQSYTGGIAKKLPFVAPALIKEQTAIATALSDADALICSLEKLIEKKRNIKQGVMQELLRPKKGWYKKRIKEIVQTPVTDGPHETPIFYEAGIPFLSVNNLVDKKIDFTNDLRYISMEDHLVYSKKCKPQKNDILLGKAASVGKVAIVETDLEFNIWSPIAMIRVKIDYSAKYIYYYLQTENILKQIEFFTNSSSQGNIGMGDIEKIEIPFPKALNEQKEIATIVSDLDNEITSLEKKLSKTKLLKQGMMQELLTGKIRLV